MYFLNIREVTLRLDDYTIYAIAFDDNPSVPITNGLDFQFQPHIGLTIDRFLHMTDKG